MIISHIEKTKKRKNTKRKLLNGIDKRTTKRRRGSSAKEDYTSKEIDEVPHDPLWNTFTLHRQRVQYAIPGAPMGSGSMKDPYRIPLRLEANSTGCIHCPLGIEACLCQEIEAIISKHLQHVYATTSLRRTHAYGRSPLNSKSVLPVFVSRLVRTCQVNENDVVWDLGCGIGSVVMQFALQTGASAIGIDIQGENITIARKTWTRVRKDWMKKYPKRRIGKVEFLENDIFAELSPHVTPVLQKIDSGKNNNLLPPTVIWAANLLFTPSMNNKLASVLHHIEALRSVACMVDIYPHNRLGASRKRDPEPYKKFPIMEDHISQADCYEWTEVEKRPFYTYQAKRINQ